MSVPRSVIAERFGAAPARARPGFPAPALAVRLIAAVMSGLAVLLVAAALLSALN